MYPDCAICPNTTTRHYCAICPDTTVQSVQTLLCNLSKQYNQTLLLLQIDIHKPDIECRWFGLGFLFYWCIGTPLLFKSYRFGKARGFWHYTTTQHNLWASYYLCLVRSVHCPASMACNAMQCACARYLLAPSALVQKGIRSWKCYALLLPKFDVH